jgi:hydrogenase maturation factor
MRLGPEALEALRTEVNGLLRPGDELVAAGAAGLEITGELLSKEAEFLKKRFNPSFLRKAAALEELYGIGRLTEEKEWSMLLKEEQVSGWMEAGAEGFLGVLWKLAEASGVGLLVDLRKVPIRQETIEICECFDVNPYQAPSKGLLLVGVPNGYSLVEQFHMRGIPAAVIGKTNGENARLLKSGETCRYLDRPRQSSTHEEVRK